MPAGMRTKWKSNIIVRTRLTIRSQLPLPAPTVEWTPNKVEIIRQVWFNSNVVALATTLVAMHCLTKQTTLPLIYS